jgi:hypothetical protein
VRDVLGLDCIQHQESPHLVPDPTRSFDGILVVLDHSVTLKRTASTPRASKTMTCSIYLPSVFRPCLPMSGQFITKCGVRTLSVSRLRSSSLTALNTGSQPVGSRKSEAQTLDVKITMPLSATQGLLDIHVLLHAGR